MSEYPPLYYAAGQAMRARWPVDTSMDPRLKWIGYDGPDHLNLGSGVNPIPGATNVDVQPVFAQDLAFDFREPWPLGDATYDKVTMFEALEHVPPVAALHIAREAHRVLRPNGLFIAETPDMRRMCQEWLAGNVGIMVGGIYGGYDNPLIDGHYYGYTADSLGLLVMLGGFLRYVTGPGKDYHAAQIPTVRVEAVKVPTR